MTKLKPSVYPSSSASSLARRWLRPPGDLRAQHGADALGLHAVGGGGQVLQAEHAAAALQAHGRHVVLRETDLGKEERPYSFVG